MGCSSSIIHGSCLIKRTVFFCRFRSCSVLFPEESLVRNFKRFFNEHLVRENDCYITRKIRNKPRSRRAHRSKFDLWIREVKISAAEWTRPWQIICLKKSTYGSVNSWCNKAEIIRRIGSISFGWNIEKSLLLSGEEKVWKLLPPYFWNKTSRYTTCIYTLYDAVLYEAKCLFLKAVECFLLCDLNDEICVHIC